MEKLKWFRFQPEPAVLTSHSDSVSLTDTPLEAIQSGANLTGELDIVGQLVIDFGFGVDDQGFFIAADSALIAELNVHGQLQGNLELFGLGAAADFQLAPALSFALLDTNGDQRIHESEYAGALGGLDLVGSRIDAQLTLDATLGFLGICPNILAFFYGIITQRIPDVIPPCFAFHLANVHRLPSSFRHTTQLFFHCAASVTTAA